MEALKGCCVEALGAGVGNWCWMMIERGAEECGGGYEGVVVRSVGSAMNTKIPFFAPSCLLESGLARQKTTPRAAYVGWPFVMLWLFSVSVTGSVVMLGD